MRTTTTVRNCKTRGFDFVCPRNWSALSPAGQPDQRLCTKCNEIVYFCVTDEQTLKHARAGHCIARSLPDDAELPAVYLGRPSVVPAVTSAQERALNWSARESGIDDALKNIDAERNCPQCRFPAQDWRVDCRVCGLEIGRVRRLKA